MPLLHEPEVSLEDVRLRSLSISSLELDVAIRVGNKNLVGVTLKELPFSVLCSSTKGDQELAHGNTGRVQIAARGDTLLHVPVRSKNAALIGALATFFTKGEVQVTIKGTATIDAVLFSWSIPFAKTMPVTMEQVAGSLSEE
jgi:LEA14-like dessication related protein